MRGGLVVAILLTATVAGCLGAERGTEPIEPIALTGIEVPDGARLVETAAGAALEWTNVSFLFSETITIPEGATIVRAEARLLGTTGTIRTYLVNDETERRRCNQDTTATAWNAPRTTEHQCTGLAAIDPPGTKWRLQVTGPVNVDTGLSLANLVRVVFEKTPLDGVAAELDLTQLSMPTYTPQETVGSYIESFDGTPIWVEVTLPDGEGPWPTVIASSPYNGLYNRIPHGGPPAMWGYWTHDWVTRGYAAVNADVRGFGLSGGCVEIWSENEQRDQAMLVDWVSQQSWSDDSVGFYGQSYVGTTPVAAAVQAPEALKAIIAVAPVINAYEDWHHGGVPNGENTLSPVAYQVLTDVPPTPDQDTEPYLDPLTLATNIGKGLCDATLVARANDPRAVYDAFYAERDFKPRAGDVKAAVMFTQGFEDANVKSSMIPDWFNGLQAPKLGIFGHWVHQHPTRADAEILMLGWMDQYVKGKPLGFEKLPKVLVRTNTDMERHAAAWPDEALEQAVFVADWSAGVLNDGADPDAGGATLNLSPANAGTGTGADILRLRYTLPSDLAMSGSATLSIPGTLNPPGNAFLRAAIYDVHDTKDLITYGMVNLAHDETHRTWSPVTGPTVATIHFLPTEYVFQEARELLIELHGVVDPYAAPGLGLPVGTFEAQPGSFQFATVPMDAYTGLPATAQH